MHTSKRAFALVIDRGGGVQCIRAHGHYVLVIERGRGVHLNTSKWAFAWSAIRCDGEVMLPVFAWSPDITVSG